jgi:hypothetical protein
VIPILYVNMPHWHWPCGLFGRDELKVFSPYTKTHTAVFKEYLMARADFNAGQLV